MLNDDDDDDMKFLVYSISLLLGVAAQTLNKPKTTTGAPRALENNDEADTTAAAATRALKEDKAADHEHDTRPGQHRIRSCPWSYEPSNDHQWGPEEWGTLPRGQCKNHVCDSKKAQSPIDLDKGTATSKAPSLVFEPANWSGGKGTWSPAEGDVLSFHAHCHDCTLKVRASSPTSMSKTYTLKQIHFHTPSEHTVKGRNADGELHLVHSNDAGATLVIGILLRATDDEKKVTPFAKQLFGDTGVEYAEGAEQKFDFLKSRKKAIDFSPLATNGVLTKSFFQYKGSFTTPPCTEGVEWYVFEHPLEVSRNTILAHKKLNGVPESNKGYVGLKSVHAPKLKFHQPKFGPTGSNRPTVGSARNSSTVFYGDNKLIKSRVYPAKKKFAALRDGFLCTFPFKYHGKTYNNCGAPAEESVRLWCATETDASGTYHDKMPWVFCSFGLRTALKKSLRGYKDSKNVGTLIQSLQQILDDRK